jgi:hypothetical protein
MCQSAARDEINSNFTTFSRYRHARHRSSRRYGVPRRRRYRRPEPEHGHHGNDGDRHSRRAGCGRLCVGGAQDSEPELRVRVVVRPENGAQARRIRCGGGQQPSPTRRRSPQEQQLLRCHLVDGTPADDDGGGGKETFLAVTRIPAPPDLNEEGLGDGSFALVGGDAASIEAVATDARGAQLGYRPGGRETDYVLLMR